MSSELLKGTNHLVSSLRRSKAVNVNNAALKQEAIELARTYFQGARAAASQAFLADKVKQLDEFWQSLLRLAHGNNSKSSYLNILQQIMPWITDLAVAEHTIGASGRNGKSQVEASAAEKMLLETLDRLVPTAGQSYRQGLTDLAGDHRTSYRGTACEFREALRESLDALAPDKEVLKQSWFKLEPNAKGPTMKQKVRFILTSRQRSKTQRESAEKAVDLVENLCGEVTRAVYDRASLSTHIQSAKQEVMKMKRYLDAVFFDILEVEPIAKPKT